MMGGKGTIERDFFYGIMGTIKEEEMKALINKSLKQRFEQAEDDNKPNYILVNEEWKENLMS